MTNYLMKLSLAIIVLAFLSSSTTAQNHDMYANHEIDIYTISSLKKGNDQRVTFIPLTYLGSDWAYDPKYERDDDPIRTFEPIHRVNKDSAVIADKYLGENKKISENHNYHKLSREHRRLFLRREGIAPDDSIFYYHALSDQLLSYSVKSQPLVARVNTYKYEPPVREADYQVGFEIQSLPLGKNSVNEFIYIGQKSPFVRGEAQPIKWKQIPNNRFPLTWQKVYDSLKEQYRFFKFMEYKPEKTYSFTAHNYHFYIWNLLLNKEVSARYLMVTGSKTDTCVNSKIYYKNDGRYLHALNNDTDYQYQWTGRLFKNKPPVIHGFWSPSSGCPSIDFLDPSVPPLRIKCDNRH